jgi:hypothetical protein
VALWIANDETLYVRAVNYARKDGLRSYENFIHRYMPSEYGDITPDGVSWTDPHLDHDQLDTFIRELAE